MHDLYFLYVTYIYYILSRLGGDMHGDARRGIARLAKGYVEMHDLLFLIIIYKYYIVSRRGNAGHCLVRHCLARLAKGHVEMHDLLFFVDYIHILYIIEAGFGADGSGSAMHCFALLANKVM